ncbi:MAG: YjbQ family protein [Candidatus Omnitrophica bacterium]|nr:YjbQ family protein [Candidatus Omnitrophota bacterium]
MIISKDLSVRTKGNIDVIDITDAVNKVLTKSGLTSGVITLFVKGSTGSLTTIEYEPNLVVDLKRALERLIPSDIEYAHTKTWGDYNGHSHIRASILGPSLVIPFANRKLLLGTWQQIVLIDFDTHPRQRDIVAQLIGE